MWKMKYVLIFFTNFSEKFLILTRIERDMVINVYWSSCKVPVFLFRFKWNLNFLYRFSENNEMPYFMKIRPVGADLFHANGQTDMTKLISVSCKIVNAPKNVCCTYTLCLTWFSEESIINSVSNVNRFVVLMENMWAYREIETKFLDISCLEVYIQHVKTILIFFIPCIAFVVIHLYQQILETEIKKVFISL